MCCVGHGKSIVDAINGTDKNIILRVSGRRVKDAADAVKNESKEMKVHVVQDGEPVSAAEDCKNILESNYNKIEKKTKVKKEGRTINERFWHVRKKDVHLNMSKYETIKLKEKGTTFNDMYHFYTCKELGKGVVAMRRVPCYCKYCNLQLKKPWVNGVRREKQDRFKTIDNFFLSSIVGDENKWRIVDITETKSESVEEDEDQIRFDSLQSQTIAISQKIKKGNFGAVNTCDPNTQHGYWIVKFTDDNVYTDQTTGS